MKRFGELQKIFDEIKMAKFHATYDERSDGPGHHVPVFRWVDGTSTMIEGPPHGANSVVVRAVMEGARAVAELSDASHRIMRDGRLSAAGKSQDLDQIRRRPIENIAILYKAVLAFGQELEEREAKRYAPPEPEHNGSALTLSITLANDREVRDVIRAMSADERHALVKRLDSGEFKWRILAAILRDPAESLSWLHDVAAAIWRKYVDQSDVEGRAHLDIDTASYEWGRRALMMLGGVALPYARFERTELALLVAETNGHQVYGLTTGEVVAALRSYQAKTAA